MRTSPRDAFVADVTINAKTVRSITDIQHDADASLLSLKLTMAAPFDTALVQYSASYIEHYPYGDVVLLFNRRAYPLNAAAGVSIPEIGELAREIALEARNPLPGFAAVTQEIVAGCAPTVTTPAAPGHAGDESPPTNTSGGGMFRAGSDGSRSWLHEPTMDLDVGAMNSAFFADLDAVAKLNPVAADLGGGQMEVVIQLPLAKAAPKPGGGADTALLEGLGLNPAEPLTVRFVVDTHQYGLPSALNFGVRDVQVGQSTNFLRGNFGGAVGQLRRVLLAFVPMAAALRHARLPQPVLALVQRGYGVTEVEAALAEAKGDVVKAASELHATMDQHLLGMKGAKAERAAELSSARELPPTSDGIFLGAVKVLKNRIATLPDFCVICDRVHVTACGLAVASVCSREACVFRLTQLNVARDVATQIAVQTGVVDLLIVFARAAAKSTRISQILDPYPTLVGPDGKAVVSPDKRDDGLVREIMEKFPDTSTLTGAANARVMEERMAQCHKHSRAMFEWIVSSNKARLIKMDPQQHVSFMGTKHQFRINLANAERHHTFEALKRQHGASWVFHGSRVENWHSIMRNGLRNFSGTKNQLNGQAYGAGIYLSPDASTSFGYSNMSSGSSPAAMASHMAEDYIARDSFHCIAIGEVINHDLRKNGSIWVMPHDDHVMLRFLFVYTNGFSAGYNAKLEDATTANVLNGILEGTN